MAEPNCEQLLASAVKFLIEGKEYVAANVLLSCNLIFEGRSRGGDFGLDTLAFSLLGPRAVYELFTCDQTDVLFPWDLPHEIPPATQPDFPHREKAADIRRAIEKAIDAVLPTDCRLRLRARAELMEVTPRWRQELLQIAQGKEVHNQAVEAETVFIWQNHRFRSKTEIRIAQALEKEKVLFFANCKARLGFSERENREPDFLVCEKGKWGILEVDGQPFHPASRASEDHDRDRLFKAHGITLVEHFDAGECFENAEGVVKKFLYLLRQVKQG